MKRPKKTKHNTKILTQKLFDQMTLGDGCITSVCQEFAEPGSRLVI